MRKLFAMLVFIGFSGPALALETIYTSLTDCRELEFLEEGYFSRWACDAPEGWQVELVEEDARSYLILSHHGMTHSLQNEMQNEFTFGAFPGVGKLAEWRMGPQGPEALIVRMHYMREDQPKSVLFVFNLRGVKPVLAGTTTSNEQARRIADQP